MGHEGDDASADVIDPRKCFAAPGDMASGHGVPKMLAEQEEEEEQEVEEEEKEEEGLMLDWGDGSETKRRDAHGGGKGTSTGRPLLQASPEVEAEYESTLIELKVRVLPYDGNATVAVDQQWTRIIVHLLR